MQELEPQPIRQYLPLQQHLQAPMRILSSTRTVVASAVSAVSAAAALVLVSARSTVDAIALSLVLVSVLVMVPMAGRVELLTLGQSLK